MKRIDYHGPRQFQGFLEDVAEHVLQYVTRRGTIPVYVGKLVGIRIKPTPHFIFDDRQNATVEEMLGRYLETGATNPDEERIYQEARECCIATSSLPERVQGAYQRDADSLVFPPHSFLDFEYASRHRRDDIDLNKLGPESLQYLNACDLPHAIAHELLHWDIAEICPYQELREAFAAREEVAQDPRLIHANFYEILNEGIERSDPRALHYSTVWQKIYETGLYDLNEVIAECVSFPIISSSTGRLRLSVEAPVGVIDLVHHRLEQHGIKETLAFAKQLMDNAYSTETNVYDLLRRA